MSVRARVPIIAIVVALAAACGGTETDPLDEGPAYSLGTCPELVEGLQSFASDVTTYDVTVRLPAEPEGAPILFVWHWLNGSAAQIEQVLDITSLVDDGVVAILPDSASAAEFEWDFGRVPEGNADLQLFYDLLGCARRQLGIDMDRVWSTGMSAGGLWTGYLILRASEWVTAAAPFSGGVIGQVPSTARSIPVMLTWGGPDDEYAGTQFDLASRDLSFWLQEFHHPIVECVHDLGHTLPPESPALLERFLRDQRWGDPDPFADGLPPEFPAWCTRP